MERPIIMSTEMVRAVKAGRKTQTRRIVTGIPLDWLIYDFTPAFVADPENNLCPYGKVGDLLWVRESFYPEQYFNGIGYGHFLKFKADYEGPVDWNWKPSIHMPKTAARIWLQIEELRIERLRDISEDDAIAEGIEPDPTGFSVEILNGKEVEVMNYRNYNKSLGYLYIKPIASFRSLWNSIHKPESSNKQPDNWHSNPWVWVLTFKVLSTTGKPETGNQQQLHEPRPEETSITTKPTAEEQTLQTESLKNCTRAGVREFDPDPIEEEDDDDDEFDHCSDCDLPDACADFGCAIKRGLRSPETII